MKMNIKHFTKIGLLLTSLCAFLSGCSNSDYYASISNDLRGDELKEALSELIYHEKAINYANVSSYYTKTDSAGIPNKIKLFYNGQVVSTKMTDPDYMPYTSDDDDPNGINREHVWCQSRFRIYGSMTDPAHYGKAENPGPATDLYNVRPCLGSINQARSNYIYSESHTSQTFDPAVIEGGEEASRGEIARILFYCATRYLKLELVEDDSVPYSGRSNKMGNLDYLLKWNLAYAPSDLEKQRNDVIQEAQGNRNPFVDHPEYACRIYGNKSNATKEICKEYL